LAGKQEEFGHINAKATFRTGIDPGIDAPLGHGARNADLRRTTAAEESLKNTGPR